MPTLHMRLHPGLIRNETATWREQHRTPHFRQGDWDGACGPLVVMSAMVILRVASWAEIRTFRHLSGGRWEETLFKALEGFFYGTTDADMFALLDTLAARVRYRTTTGSMKVVREFAVQRLGLDELVILGINGWGVRQGHWILAVGTESVNIAGIRTINDILCLDPAKPSSAVAPFNARLELSPDMDARNLRYQTEDTIRNVTCKMAIALSLR